MRYMRFVPVVLLGLSLAAFAQKPPSKNTEGPGKNTEQGFASGGKVEMHLSAGDYEILGTDAAKYRDTSTGPNADQVNIFVETQNASGQISVRSNHSDNLHIRIELPK